MAKTGHFSGLCAGGVLLGILCFPAAAIDIGISAAGVDVGVSVGSSRDEGTRASASVGGLGASVGADVTAGGRSGLGADVKADIGGTNARATASVGGANGVGAGVGIGTASGSRASVGAGLGGTAAAAAGPNAPGVEGRPSGGGANGSPPRTLKNRIQAGIVAGMTEQEFLRYRTRCAQVMARPSSFDRGLVDLCKLVQTARR